MSGIKLNDLKTGVFRSLAIAAGIVAVSSLEYRYAHLNATTAGFIFIVIVLMVAAFVGTVEAVAGSIAATFCFNYFFLPPVLTLVIADPENWVALFALLVTAFVASRLAERARMQTRTALDRQQEMELLYAISRSILLSDPAESMSRRITFDLARVFQFSSVLLYDARTVETYHAGPEELNLNKIEPHVHEAAVNGTSFVDPNTGLRIFAIRLGGQPIGSLAIRPARVSETALQSLTNLVAITLEKVRSQEAANRREAERQSETLKSTLLDAIAHEFKTPLTSVKAAASMLVLNPGADSGRIRELGSIVEEESDRMETLVSEAIQMARIEGGKLKMDRRLVSPAQIVGKAIAKSALELEGHVVTVKGGESAIEISIDADLIELAIRNLLGNAAKFSGAGLPSEIHIANHRDGVLIEVRDFGPGILEADQGRIFEKFYRAPQTSSHVPGSGMGLNIVREIVRAHGGQIWVESEPGQGAHFSMVLPAVPGAAFMTSEKMAAERVP